VTLNDLVINGHTDDAAPVPPPPPTHTLPPPPPKRCVVCLPCLGVHAAKAKDPLLDDMKKLQQETEAVSERIRKDMQRLNATSSASSPHVNVGKIVLIAIAGLAVLV